MNIQVTISELSEPEAVGLKFALEQFNATTHQEISDFGKFLTEFLRSRIIPDFVRSENSNFHQKMQQRLRGQKLPPDARVAITAALDAVLPQED